MYAHCIGFIWWVHMGAYGGCIWGGGGWQSQTCRHAAILGCAAVRVCCVGSCTCCAQLSIGKTFAEHRLACLPLFIHLASHRFTPPPLTLCNRCCAWHVLSPENAGRDFYGILGISRDAGVCGLCAATCARRMHARTHKQPPSTPRIMLLCSSVCMSECT